MVIWACLTLLNLFFQVSSEGKQSQGGSLLAFHQETAITALTLGEQDPETVTLCTGSPPDLSLSMLVSASTARHTLLSPWVTKDLLTATALLDLSPVQLLHNVQRSWPLSF